MPKTLTIACSGTNFDEDSEDLVAYVAKNIEGKRYQDWLIFAGPGSKAIASQSYNPLKKTSLSTFGLLKEVSSYPYNNLVYKVKGLAGGTGMDLNTGFLLEFLEGLYSFALPQVINMFGWSRGACTCVMMANALDDYYKQESKTVTINIFAIDPVPGPGNFLSAVLSLPACVKFCTVLQMENESRPAMIGSKIRVASKFNTSLRHLPLPGNHSSGVTSGKSIEGPILEIAAFHLYSFLLQRGTELKCDLDLSNEKRCEAYAEMILNQEEYLTLGAVNRLVGDEEDYSSMGHYLLHKSYFINDDHEAAFKAAYREVYDRVLDFYGKIASKPLEELDKPPIFSDLSTLKRRRTKADEVWEKMPKNVQKSLLRCDDIKALRYKLKSPTKPSPMTSLSLMTDTTVKKPVKLKLD